MVEADHTLAEKLVLSCHILSREGHSDITLGHVTARLPGQRCIHMKPAGLGLEEVQVEDIILIDLEGNKLAGNRPRHSEYPIHTEIYKARPEINCVIHTHPLYATALGAVGGELHPVSHEGVLFPDLPLFTQTSELIRTPDQGRALAGCLGEAWAALMQNHGVVVVGESIEEATVYAVLLEKAARVQCLARDMGGPVWSSKEESKRKVQQIYHPDNIKAFWNYYVRNL